KNQYLMDIRNRYYERACLAHAVRLAQRMGADGIKWDNVEASLSWVDGGVPVPEYPTQRSWVNAEYRWARTVGPAAHRAGLLQLPNVSGGAWSGTPSFRRNIIIEGRMDGSMEESWTDAGLGTAQQEPYWAGKLADADWAEAHH